MSEHLPMTTELSTQASPRRFIEPMNSMTVDDAIDRFSAPISQDYKIQILRPFGVYSRRSYSSTITLPIGQAYLAGILEGAGYEVHIIDAIGEDLEGGRVSQDGRYRIQGLSSEKILARIDQNTDVLGISLMFSQEWPPQRDLITEIRSVFPNLTIVVGGEHATALPEHVLKSCPAIDYLVRGEGELTFLELVSALANAADSAVESPMSTTFHVQPGICSTSRITSSETGQWVFRSDETCQFWPLAAVRINAPSVQIRSCGPRVI